MLDIAVAKPGLPKSGALVLLLEEGATADSPTAALWKEADEATGGAIGRALAVAEFKGRKGQSTTILAPGANLSRVVAIGLGKLAEATGHGLEEAGGHMTAALAKEPAAAVSTVGLTPGQAASVAMGAVLRAYRFDRYKTKKGDGDEETGTISLTIGCRDYAGARRAAKSTLSIAEGVVIARDLVNEPPNVLYPEEFARRAETLSKLGVEVEILDEKKLEKIGMRALLAVGQGSRKESRVVVMRWNGAKGGGKEAGKGARDAAKPVAFIGKGVCFDSGGISIKPAGSMEDMKGDMAGAACVVGLMHALAARKAKVNAIGVIGLVENMPDGNAQRPGDIVRSLSGQTIEIINTDAEGRLVLADVLWYVQDRFKPAFMIDLATLTGAVLVALGQENAGLFSNDDGLCE
jgi:leucyl aminopeptidase